MAGDSEKISELPDYPGGVAQAAIDGASLPVAIGNVSNAKIRVADVSLHISQRIRSDRLVAGDNIQIDNDSRVISATDTVYNDAAIVERAEEIYTELGAEIERAAQAEQGLSASIASEAIRAAAAETNLQGQIDIANERITGIENLGDYAGAFDTYALLPKNTSGFSQAVTVNDFATVRADETRGNAVTRYVASSIAPNGAITWAYDVTYSTDISGKADNQQSLAATSNTDSNTDTGAYSNTLPNVLQTIWNKIRSVANNLSGKVDKSIILNELDFNSVIITGVYDVRNSSTNAPNGSGTRWNLTVFSNNGIIIQMARYYHNTSPLGDRVAVRSRNEAGTWTGWQYIAIQSDLAAIATDLTSIANNLSGKVSKAGDTMTGQLTMANGVPLKFGNTTLNMVGDDVSIGDQDVGGTLIVRGENNIGEILIRDPGQTSGGFPVRASINNKLGSNASAGGDLSGTFPNPSVKRITMDSIITESALNGILPDPGRVAVHYLDDCVIGVIGKVTATVYTSRRPGGGGNQLEQLMPVSHIDGTGVVSRMYMRGGNYNGNAAVWQPWATAALSGNNKILATDSTGKHKELNYTTA